MSESNNKSEEALPPVCLLAKLSSIWLLAIPLLAIGIISKNLQYFRIAQFVLIASVLLGLITLVYIFIARLFNCRPGGAIFAVIAILISMICHVIFFPAFLRANKQEEQRTEVTKYSLDENEIAVIESKNCPMEVSNEQRRCTGCF